MCVCGGVRVGVGRLEKIKRMPGTVSFLRGGKVKTHKVMWKPRNECRDRSVRASATLPPPNIPPQRDLWESDKVQDGSMKVCH